MARSPEYEIFPQSLLAQVAGDIYFTRWIMEYHECANLFPMMSKDELFGICENMRQYGYDKTAPIVLHEGKILDGRNRQLAADTVGVTPNYIEFDNGDPLEFVIRHNLHRRHLNETQRAIIAGRLANLSNGQKTSSANLQRIPITQPQAASMLNVSPRTVATVKAIEKAAPELVGKMERGEMTANQAHTEMRRSEVISKLENIEAQKVKESLGVYDVLVIDPPWPMVKIERDVAPNQVGFEYPTMTIEEIKNINIPSASNCHMWLWTTQKYLPDAFDILNAWDAKYVCAFVWHKVGGFQPFGLPQYNAEFALYARRGYPVFIDLKNFKLCFDAPRGAHSEKPEEFYELVRRVTTGRRLDMFNRRVIKGFDTWGNEAV
jgi:N6-adenosine-specific RNA methylase IME4